MLQVSLSQVSDNMRSCHVNLTLSRYCSQRCLTNDWKFHRMTCEAPEGGEERRLGSRRLKGRKKEEHVVRCDSLLWKFDSILANVKLDGYRRTFSDYEESARCLLYKPDKLRLERIIQTVRDCLTCGQQTCQPDCQQACACAVM